MNKEDRLVRTPEEFELQGRAFDLEDEYFQDFRTQRYYKKLMQSGFDGPAIHVPDDQCDMPSLEGWRFRIEDEIDGNPDAEGRCDHGTRTITIRTDHVENDAVIAHEILHAYIGMPGESGLAKWPDWEFFFGLQLYRKLSEEIPDLDIILMRDLMVYGYDVNHDTLFLLKSLDLDLRLGKPLGTVRAYERLKAVGI